MKIDWYTKAVLTVIAIGVGLLVFQQKPVREAQAFMGGGEMISAASGIGVYHLKDGKVRLCVSGTKATECRPWSK